MILISEIICHTFLFSTLFYEGSMLIASIADASWFPREAFHTVIFPYVIQNKQETMRILNFLFPSFQMHLATSIPHSAVTQSDKCQIDFFLFHIQFGDANVKISSTKLNFTSQKANRLMLVDWRSLRWRAMAVEVKRFCLTLVLFCRRTRQCFPLCVENEVTRANVQCTTFRENCSPWDNWNTSHKNVRVFQWQSISNFTASKGHSCNGL